MGDGGSGARRALAGLLLAALLCACTTGPGGVGRTTTAGDVGDRTPPSVDAAIVLRLQTIGPSGRTPADVARVAGADGCVSYQPGPYVPAGPTWEIHLLVPANRLGSSVAALHELPGAYQVREVPLSAYSATPTAVAGHLVDAIPC
jgi:hypothetical protein